MPFTEEQLASLDAVFENLPTPVKEMLKEASTADTASAIAAVVGKRRGEGMSQALSALVTISIANWSAAKAAADLADGASIGDSLRAVRAAWDAEDTQALGPAVIAFCASAFKNFGV